MRSGTCRHSCVVANVIVVDAVDAAAAVEVVANGVGDTVFVRDVTGVRRWC